MKIGNYKIVIKPALVVLVAAVAIAVVAIPFAKRVPAEAAPEHGYIAPDHWKFESRDGAEATLKPHGGGALEPEPTASGAAESQAPPGTSGAPKPSASGAPKPVPSSAPVRLLNAEEGFTLDVTRVGKTPDCVYLRNSVNLDNLSRQADPTLTFEASAPEPFCVTFIIRDPLDLSGAFLWSKTFRVVGSGQSYSVTIPQSALRKSLHPACIIAAHMGTQTGMVEMSKVRLL